MRFFIIIIALFLSGCAMKTLPPLNLYTINENIEVPRVSNSPYKNRVLKVSAPLSLSTPLGYKIYFKYKNGDSGAYQNSQWQIPLYKQLQKFFITALSKANLFKSVVPIESSVYEDLRLESSVYTLENQIEDNISYAVVDIELRLIDMKDRSILKKRRFRYKERAPTFDAKGYINALNSALEKLANDMVIWLSR